MYEDAMRAAVRATLEEWGLRVESSERHDAGFDLLASHPGLRHPLRVQITDGDLERPSPLGTDLGHTVVAAPHLSPARKGEVTARGLAGWVDAAGNADITVDNLRIRVSGNPESGLARAARRSQSRGWAARPTGVRVLFGLLTDASAMTARLVDIAETAQVSVATAQRTITDLAEQGLIDVVGRGERIWLDRPGAIRAWLDGYTRNVVPHLRQVPFHTPTSLRNLPQLVERTGAPLWVSGGAAVAASGGDIVPDVTVVYVPSYAMLLGRSDVEITVPDQDHPSNLLVRTSWWPDGTYPPGSAPSLLVYADAVTSGDPRVAHAAAEVIARDPDLRAALGR